MTSLTQDADEEDFEEDEAGEEVNEEILSRRKNSSA